MLETLFTKLGQQAPKHKGQLAKPDDDSLPTVLPAE